MIQSTERWRVGLLASRDYPMFGHMLQHILDRGVTVDAVFLDAKGFGPKAQKIHDERTGGRLPRIAIESFESEAIPFYFVASHCSEVCADLVRRLGIDVLVNVGTPRILKPVILRAAKVGLLSCHPGLIPNYRGCTNVEWAVFNDDPVGNTVFFMSPEIDRGPIVLQEQVHFSAKDNYEDVRVKVQEAGFDLLARGLAEVVSSHLTGDKFPFPDEGHYFPVIDPAKMADVREKLSRGEYAYQKG